MVKNLDISCGAENDSVSVADKVKSEKSNILKKECLQTKQLERVIGMSDKRLNELAINNNSNCLVNEERGINPNRFLSNDILQLFIGLGKLHKPKKIIDLSCEYESLILSFQNEAEIITGFNLYTNNVQTIKEQGSLISNKQGNMIYEHITGKYDLVFCIPPLGVRIRVGQRNIPSEILFIEKGLSILEDKGTLLFLCSEAFLVGNMYHEIRNTIMKNYNLKAIINIPPTRRGPVGINLSLLVIQNTESNEWDEVLMPEYQNHSCELVVKKEHMINRWNRNFFDPKYSEINEMLNGKEVYKLEELGEIFQGSHFGRDERKSSGEYLVLTPRNVRNKEKIQIDERDTYIEKLNSETKKRSVLQLGDIVISLRGSRAMYVYKENDPPCVAGSFFAVIRAKDNEYIKTYLDTKEGQKLFNLQADRKSLGTTIQSLRFQDLRKIRIPIIPIQNLNRISDKYIEGINNKEELELLKRQLEIQKAKCDSLQQTNDQLMSFFANRFDAIDEKLNTLIEKVDEVLDIVKGLESEVALIKTLRTDEEQIINFIEQKIDEAAENISNNNLHHYVDIAKAWIDPNWFKLELLSKVFLPNAELLYANISKMEKGDPSTFIIQYYRTLENELLNKIFKPYIRDLKERNIVIEEAFLQDLQLNENGKPKNRNKDSYKFAKQILDLQSKDESEWFFELGTMSLTLIKMTGSHADNSPLFKDFKEFLLKLFDERFIDREYYNKIFTEVRLLRNKAAHPNVIESSEALKGREVIKSLLKTLLEMYK